MSLHPLLDATPVMQIHIASGILAMAIGPIGIWRRRYDRLHKIAGYTWVLAMATLALTSFGISGVMELVGPFSPLHGLAVWVLAQLWLSVRAARQGNITAHKEIMRGLYLGGVWVAFAVNFLPGRTISRTIFGDNELASWGAIAIILVVTLSLWTNLPARLKRRFA